MRTPLRITLGLLALGASTSVLVAWASFYLVDTMKPPTDGGFSRIVSGGTMSMWAWERWPGVVGAVCVDLADASDPKASKRISALREFPIGTGRFLHGSSPQIYIYSMHKQARRPILYGLPAPCLASIKTLDVSTAKPNSATRRFLPTTPIYRGLLLNTIFYAALWAVALVLVPSLIRWLRARNGGCPSCGYDTTGLSTCPECGNAHPATTEGSSPSSSPSPVHQ